MFCTSHRLFDVASAACNISQLNLVALATFQLLSRPARKLLTRILRLVGHACWPRARFLHEDLAGHGGRGSLIVYVASAACSISKLNLVALATLATFQVLSRPARQFLTRILEAMHVGRGRDFSTRTLEAMVAEGISSISVGTSTRRGAQHVIAAPWCSIDGQGYK